MAKYYALVALGLFAVPAGAQTITCNTNLGMTFCTQSPPAVAPSGPSEASDAIGGLLRGTGYGRTSGDIAQQNTQIELMRQQLELQRQQLEFNRRMLELQKEQDGE